MFKSSTCFLGSFDWAMRCEVIRFANTGFAESC